MSTWSDVLILCLSVVFFLAYFRFWGFFFDLVGKILMKFLRKEEKPHVTVNYAHIDMRRESKEDGIIDQ